MSDLSGHKIFPEIETLRLRLIQLTELHLPDLFCLYADEVAMQYWDCYPHKDLSETEKLLKIFSDRFTSGTGICWGIKLKEPDTDGPEIIGSISYNNYVENGIGFIGYILNRKYWNQGLMSEAAAGFMKFGFESLKLHRIEAHVLPGNTASGNLLLKLGFTQEGLLRERAFFRDQHQDLIVYGKLVSDL